MADVTIFDLPGLPNPNGLDVIEAQKDLGGASGKISFQSLFSVMLPGILDQSTVGTAISITSGGNVSLLFSASILGNLSVSGSINGEDITQKVNEAPIDGNQYARKDGAWNVVDNDAAVWGQIGGTLSDQTDLQNALDGKANLSGATFTGPVTVQGAFTSLGIDDNATSTALTIDTSGEVGIGNTAPQANLDFGTGPLTPDVIHVFNDGVNRYGLGMQGTAINLYAADGGDILFTHRTASSTATTYRASVDDAGNFLFGTTTLPDGSNIGIGYQFSQGSMLSSQIITDPAVHYGFFNPNGLVGSIQTSGTSTLFNVSSDPRLKSAFVTPEYAEIMATIDLFVAEKAIGKFQWLSDLNEDPANAPWVYGFDAHKSYDLTGGMFGSPGNGPREAALYSVYGFDNETGEDQIVTPWGIDQSKVVPHAIMAVYHQDKILKDHESRLSALENP